MATIQLSYRIVQRLSSSSSGVNDFPSSYRGIPLPDGLSRMNVEGDVLHAFNWAGATPNERRLVMRRYAGFTLAQFTSEFDLDPNTANDLDSVSDDGRPPWRPRALNAGVTFQLHFRDLGGANHRDVTFWLPSIENPLHEVTVREEYWLEVEALVS